MAVLFALIRGLTRVKQNGIGNFWTDVTRSILYILIPLSILVSLALISQGVVQNFTPYETVTLVEPIALENGTQVTQQIVPMGPAASQVAIKQLGTNGGGFFGANSAHPFENPTPLSNLMEMISISRDSGSALLYLRKMRQRQEARSRHILSHDDHTAWRP